jgi:inner membrane protein
VRLETHIGFGILIGILGYYFFNLGAGFVFVAGLASFLPDIDHAMQFKWGLGQRHRTFLHNIWAMLAATLIVFVVLHDSMFALGTLIGYLSHLLLDSVTRTGISWLYPIGGFHLSGPISMSGEGEAILERIFLVVSIAVSGFLFLFKEAKIVVISAESMILVVVLGLVGYIVLDQVSRAIKSIIREGGL